MVDSELGIGLVHDRDLPELLECMVRPTGEPLDDPGLERLWSEAAGGESARAQCTVDAVLRLGGRRLPLAVVRAADVPTRFRFDPDPRPAQGEPDC